jgi:ADP-ribose pyrophosphatase YjhB (NUDIX family)
VYEAPIFCTQCANRLVERPVGVSRKTVPTCPSCGAIHWIDPKMAAGCVVVDGSRALLVKRGIEPGYGKWVFPGGHVDRGETVEQAALRETLEECGVVAEIDELIGLYSYAGRPVIVAVFRAHLAPGSPPPRPLDETLEVGWFTAEEIARVPLAFRSSADSLGRLFARRYEVDGGSPVGFDVHPHHVNLRG